LEKLFVTDKKSLLYMYRYANDYKNHVESFGLADEKYNEIIGNIEYFNNYMNYKVLTTSVDIAKDSQ